MESFAEKECSALGGLFQYIVNDLKIATPIWEDFLGKTSKLHTHIKTTVLALTAFLDAFQKIADMATNARGATKDIGSALTRLCLRHRSVETKLKIFSSALVDHLVIPLQEKLEDWKKIAYQMDKDHAKEYKRVRQDIKKRSSDTLRLQKKVRKAPKADAKKTLDTAIRDVNSKYHLLEETEKQALRKALIEERSRYCLFVNCLRPVIESELSTMYEVTHIQEVLDALAKLIEDPLGLPPASEQVILDVKSSEAGWSFRTPPGSPTSVGSRKSSTCSISSLNSSSSDSTHSPSAHQRSRSLSQPPSGAFRLSSVSSQDSGFTSQDTLFTRLPTPPPIEITDQSDANNPSRTVDATVKIDSPSPSYPDAPCAMATWPNLQDTLQFEKAAASIAKSQRPHTISSAYERHNRPTITSHTFRPLQNGNDSQLSLSGTIEDSADYLPEDFPDDCSEEATPTHKAYPPPLPLRAEEMDMNAPTIPPKPRVLMQQPKRSDFKVASSLGNYPIYVNASDICSASTKAITPVDANVQEASIKTFQMSLAATLAQNAVHQKLKETALATPDQLGSPIVPDEGACGGHAPPPPVRRSSAPKHPPVVPPHRPPKPSEHTSTTPKECSGTSWNVFPESGDSSDAHAQLMRALNARLDALQRDANELPPPPPQEVIAPPPRLRKEEVSLPDRLPPPPPEKEVVPPPRSFLRPTSRRLSDDDIPPPPLKEDVTEIIQPPPRQNFPELGRLPPPPPPKDELAQAPTKKLPRTPDKNSLLSDLELKLRSTKGDGSKFHTSPRQPLETTKAQRRVSQPTFSELLDQFPRNPKRLPPTPDRRSSLDLDCVAVPIQHRTLAVFDPHRKPDGGPAASVRVQKWLAGRGSVDVTQCHADLLGEIRGGINLRKASSDDRSAPILRHPRLKHAK